MKLLLDLIIITIILIISTSYCMQLNFDYYNHRYLFQRELYLMH